MFKIILALRARRINTHLLEEENDTYFQLGIIYAENYRLNFFVRKILSEFIFKIQSMNEEYGAGNIVIYM